MSISSAHLAITRNNAVWVIGSKERLPEIEHVTKVVEQLVKSGLLSNQEVTRIICTEECPDSIAYENHFPAKVLIVGPQEPVGQIIIFKKLVRQRAKEDGVGLFGWHKWVDAEIRKIGAEAKQIYSAIDWTGM